MSPGHSALRSGRRGERDRRSNGAGRSASGGKPATPSPSSDRIRVPAARAASSSARSAASAGGPSPAGGCRSHEGDDDRLGGGRFGQRLAPARTGGGIGGDAQDLAVAEQGAQFAGERRGRAGTVARTMADEDPRIHGHSPCTALRQPVGWRGGRVWRRVSPTEPCDTSGLHRWTAGRLGAQLFRCLNRESGW